MRRPILWPVGLALVAWGIAGCAGVVSVQPVEPPRASTASTPALTSTSVAASDESSATTASPSTASPDTAPSSTEASAELEAEQPPVSERVGQPGAVDGASLLVGLTFESRVDDVSTAELRDFALKVLSDERGWIAAGFTFVEDPSSSLRVVLAEGPTVDALCLPLQTRSRVSCQNGATVALNADRWRVAVAHWDGSVELYRTYLINHEIGHLIGMRHPQPRCPRAGAPAAVMEQQTSSLQGCVGNGWPRSWELEAALMRPAMIGPDPSWGPDPVPVNQEAD